MAKRKTPKAKPSNKKITNEELTHVQELVKQLRTLQTEVGALEILPHVYHRSVSGESGSLLLNHAIRDEEDDENNEFRPAWAVTTPDLALVLLKNNPIYVNGNKEEIEYFMVNGRLPN